jgi:hypothetical protein
MIIHIFDFFADGSEFVLEADSELSLWNWWKEVVFISIFTALMMNLLITQPVINQIRENFRLTLERISRRPPVRLFTF